MERLGVRVELRKISETFTGDEFERLDAVKAEAGLSWHDFLLEMLEVFERSRKLGIPEIPPVRDELLMDKIEELRSPKEKNRRG